MLPDKSNIKYRLLVMGKINHSFQVVAGSLCVSRNQRSVMKAGGTEGAISDAINDVYAFFKKYEKTMEADIKAIFG